MWRITTDNDNSLSQETHNIEFIHYEWRYWPRAHDRILNQIHTMKLAVPTDYQPTKRVNVDLGLKIIKHCTGRHSHSAAT